MADYTTGYEATSMDAATTPNMPEEDANRPIGSSAKQFKTQWKGLPELSNDEGPVKANT